MLRKVLQTLNKIANLAARIYSLIGIITAI